MRDAIRVEMRGIKCDAEGCGYADPTAIDPTGYLDAPCPLCGANLLTQADYDVIRRTKAIMALLSSDLPQVPDETPIGMIAGTAKMDGTGRIDWEIAPEFMERMSE